MNELFNNKNFDCAEPKTGHQERFLEKLKQQRAPTFKKDSTKIRKLWIPILAVAASLLLIFMLAGNYFNHTNTGELASVSPEMKETQQFYTSLIKTELEAVHASKNPETKVVIDDALIQLQKLDLEYSKLKKDLLQSGKDKRVIFAMVTNLQQRIDLLKNLMIRIDEINELKNTKNESNTI